MIGSLYLILFDGTTTAGRSVNKSVVSLDERGRGRFRSPVATLTLDPALSEHNEGDQGATSRGNAGRRRVANFLDRMGYVLGSTPQGLRQDYMRTSRATAYPVIPGENMRTRELEATSRSYLAMRSASRAASSRNESSSTPPPVRSTSPRPRAAALPS